MSWAKSGELLLAGGDNDDEPKDTLLSEGAKGEAERGTAPVAGGDVVVEDAGDEATAAPRPLPEPRMRPPPSLRADMTDEVVSNKSAGFEGGSRKRETHGRLKGRDDPGLVVLRLQSLTI